MGKIKHGMADSKTHIIWKNMKARTSNINRPDYSNYGGRGIKVCEWWLNSFQNFYDDMGVCPEGKSLDRIDNDGDYTPENCKWSTKTTQNLNQRFRKDNTSGFRGVSRPHNTGKWHAYIKISGKRVHLGLFSDIIEAAYIRDQFAAQVNGEEYKLNVLGDI